MKKLLMGIVGALMLTTSPTMAFWTAGVEVEDYLFNSDPNIMRYEGSCSVNTSPSQNAYWINHLGIADFSSVNESISYHSDRSNGNNINAAAVCWLKWFNSQDSGQLTSNASTMYGFDVVSTLGLSDTYEIIAFLLTLEMDDIPVLPNDFTSALNDEDIQRDVELGWLIASGSMNGYRGHPMHASVYQADNNGYLNNWIAEWNASDKTHSTADNLSAEITEYFYQ